jgi:hypothetical protein
MITLGLSDGSLSDGGLSESMIIKSERIDGTYVGEICGVTLTLVACG